MVQRPEHPHQRRDRDGDQKRQHHASAARPQFALYRREILAYAATIGCANIRPIATSNPATTSNAFNTLLPRRHAAFFPFDGQHPRGGTKAALIDPPPEQIAHQIRSEGDDEGIHLLPALNKAAST